MHTAVRQLGEPKSGPSQAAATDGTNVNGLGRLCGVSARERARRIVAHFGICSAPRRIPGRGRVEVDPELVAAGGNAGLAGQVAHIGTAVGAPSMQAGGLHQTAKVSEGTAAWVGNLMRIWPGSRGFQTYGAYCWGWRGEAWGDVARHLY